MRRFFTAGYYKNINKDGRNKYRNQESFHLQPPNKLSFNNYICPACFVKLYKKTQPAFQIDFEREMCY